MVEKILPETCKNEKRYKINVVSAILSVILLILSGVFGFSNISLTARVKDLEGNDVDITVKNTGEIILSSEQKPALIVNEEGDETKVNLPTVEEVDGGEIITGDNFTENNGKGEVLPVETPLIFSEATLGKCIYQNNVYGAQCVSLANSFWINYTDRAFSTCGTGMAKGAWNCKEYNAGKEFDLVTDKNDLEIGDWIIFSGGEYGHVGMAMGYPNNGYIALLGENQGGKPCDGGGSATNIINISLKNFIGAYRPKIYHIPLPPDTGIVKDED